MGFIIIIPLGALAGWGIFAIARWLRRGKYDQKWWRAFRLLGCGGIALGIWFAFFMHYKMANTRLAGFPIPVEILSREKPDAPWVKSAMPAPVRVGGMAVDLLSGIALCLMPVAVAAFFKENRRRGLFGGLNAPRQP